MVREFLMHVPMSSDEEPECCSPVRAGWCNSRIALLLTLASPTLLCNCSWFMWDVCMKEKYVLGAICYPLFCYMLVVCYVYCHWNFSCREFTVILENKAAGDLEESSSLSSCPNRILVPVLSDIGVFFRISSDEDCFSRPTALCPFFCVCGFLFVVFLCNVFVVFATKFY